MKNDYRYKLIVTKQLRNGKRETRLWQSRNLLTLNRVYKKLLLNEKDGIVQMCIYDYQRMMYVKYYEPQYIVEMKVQDND